MPQLYVGLWSGNTGIIELKLTTVHEDKQGQVTIHMYSVARVGPTSTRLIETHSTQVIPSASTERMIGAIRLGEVSDSALVHIEESIVNAEANKPEDVAKPWDWSPQLWIAARVDDIFRSELIPIPDDYGGSPYDPGEWEYNGLKDRLKELAEIVTNNHRLNGVGSFDNVVNFTS